jgi:hypothetical protein
MPPTRCPRRLQRLIDRANKQSTSESDALREILRAVQRKRQNKGPDTHAVDLVSTVTINLIDYRITTRNELASALKEIDPPDKIHLIRECQVCSHLFWAGRVDKVVCDKHAESWRKNKQRGSQRADQARATKEAAERKIKDELKGMSRTAVALLNAIVIGRQYIFHAIDNEAYIYLKQSPLVRRVPNDRIVRRTLKMLVDREYLSHEPRGNPKEDRYFASKKLLDHRADIPSADTPEELRQKVPLAE